MTPEENKVVERCIALSAKKIPMSAKNYCWIVNSAGQGLCASCDKFWTDNGDMTRMIDREFAEKLFHDFPKLFEGCDIKTYNWNS